MCWRNRPPQRMRCPVLGRVCVGARRVAESENLQKTPLHALHVALGAKMVPFGGYDMPVQYPAGILAEHLHTRTAAGLFDVSHMGQVTLHGPDAVAAAALRPAQRRVSANMRALGKATGSPGKPLGWAGKPKG